MNQDFLKVAKQAALEAEKVIQKYSGKDQLKNIKHEDASDLSTEADLEAEKIIVSLLKQAFPGHNIISEENEKNDKGSEYTWVIDPLDGTFSFLQGIPFFGISIGLLKENKPVLGVISHIGFNNLYWGMEGKGAYLNGEKIKVSSQTKLNEAGVVLDLGHMAKRQSKIDLYVTPLITKVGYNYSFGGAVAILGMVAQGILDGNVNQAWLWDFVAGAVIVREAGGKVTDFAGEEPDWSKERLNIVASNGLIHNQILEALKK